MNDPRIPIRFIVRPEDRLATEAAITDGAAAFPPGVAVVRFRPVRAQAGHRAGCTCCTPRGPAAEALARLFLARARGEVAFFTGIAALAESAEGAAAIRAALEGDVTAVARFRSV
ncbi:MAG: hypothetical protein KGL12_06620 [Rhodospirillales bacterium]|nr:hypothetical protein [Rhodospirillales bacterium]